MEMLEKYLNQIIDTNNIARIVEICGAVVVAAVIGGLVLLAYRVCSSRFSFNKEAGLTMVIISASAALLAEVVCGNVSSTERCIALALVSLAVVFFARTRKTTSVRERASVYVIIAAVSGIACGVELFVPALAFAAVSCAIAGIYAAATSKKDKHYRRILVIEVPESIRYDGLFEATLKKYTDAFKLREIRIIGDGAVAELTYAVEIRERRKNKEFLDELRTLNANFKIAMKEYA